MARRQAQRSPRLRWRGALVLAFATIGLSACGGGGSLPPGDTPPRQGSVRFVNAIPDGPNITAFLSGIAFGPEDFAQATPLTKELVAIYTLNVEYFDPQGGITDLKVVQDIELTQEKEISFVLIGPWANPTLLRIDNVEIDFGITPNDGHLNKAGVQVVHGATSIGPVDVYLTAFGADLSTATPIASVNFGDVGQLLTIAPNAAYQVRVTDPGTTNVLFDSGTFGIDGFTRQIFLLRDNFGPSGKSFRVTRVTADGALQFPNEGTQTSMRFGNFIADAPAVDVYFTDTMHPPTFTNAPFAQLLPRTLVSPGGLVVPIKVTAAGTTTPLVLDSNIGVAADTFQTVLAGGLDAKDTTAVVSMIDDPRTIAPEARLRFMNVSPEAGGVDVYVLPPGLPIADTPATLPGVALNSAPVTPLLEGSYDVTVTRAGSQTVLIGPERISVELGNHQYTLALTDSDGGGSPIVLRRYDDLAP